MFNGIIREVGVVQSFTETKGVWNLRVKVAGFDQGLKEGDSISVNGVCLTVTNFDDSFCDFQVVWETREATTFQYLKPEDKVNLERSLCLGASIDGHLIQGHVDGVGSVLAGKQDAEDRLIQIKSPSNLSPLVIPKGSIAVDGISLTIQRVEDDGFWVAIIPHTYQETNLSEKKEGDFLNLEVDVLGKYVYHFLKHQNLPKV